MGQGMSEVAPNVFVTSALVARQGKVLDQYGITHVVSVLTKPIDPFPHREYLLISAKDHVSQDLLQFVSQCNDFIHNARLNQGKVMIHCVEGKSRSPSIACFYMMTITGMSWAETMNSLRGVRTLVDPNFAFQKQLKHFYDKLMLQERERLFTKFGAYDLIENDISFLKKNLEKYHAEQRRRIAMTTPGARPRTTIKVLTKRNTTETTPNNEDKPTETTKETDQYFNDVEIAQMSPESRRLLDDMFSS